MMRGRGRPHRARLYSLRAAATFVVVTTTGVRASRAADTPAPEAGASDESAQSSAPARAEKPKKASIEDMSTKRAAFEVAGYDDTDHVEVLTPSVALGIENVSGASLHATYLVDVVSAASADIVSTASPRWQEIRQAGSLTGEYKPHDFGVAVGGSFSREPDYLSYGAYATITKDFDEKNWTLFFGYGFSHDTIGRCGDNGACTPFSVFSRELQRGSFNGGVNFVLGTASLASLIGDVVIENGDQSKPYRYIPLFAPDEAPYVPKGASIDWVNSTCGETQMNPAPPTGTLSSTLATQSLLCPGRALEQLPLLRQRFSLTGRYAHRLETSTLRLEERLYRDSWGLMASSSDARWIFDLGQRFAVWPHARFHVQSGVTFWQLAYTGYTTGASPSQPVLNVPEYRTGDRELGPLWTADGGFGIKWYIGSSDDPEKWSVQFTADGMYTSFLDDLYLTYRIAGLGALSLEGEF